MIYVKDFILSFMALFSLVTKLHQLNFGNNSNITIAILSKLNMHHPIKVIKNFMFRILQFYGCFMMAIGRRTKEWMD